MRASAGVALLIALSAAGCWQADLYPFRSKGSNALYVAPDGDDNHEGTLERPFKTVAKARDVARSLSSNMTGDIVVYLRGGTYPQTSTLTFTDADSGKGGFHIKYVAYANERPLITGGQPIPGPWTLFDSEKNIYATSGVTARFRQLYVNGIKAIRARAPDLASGGAPNFYRSTGFSNSDRYIQVAASDVANWNNLSKVEMHYMTAWADNTLRIASLTTSGNNARVKFQSPEGPLLFVRSHPNLQNRQCYYFENAFELLDQPGEWYLDESKDVLYYKPRADEVMATAVAVAPMLETVMSIAGPSTSQPAAYLWFQGLTFAHSTFMRPSHSGFLDEESGQYNLTATADAKFTVGHPPAGVTVTNARQIRFERNMFTQMAATGLDLVSGTRDNTIIGNVFTDIGGSGISVGKFAASEETDINTAYNPDDKNEICTNETIKNNYIANVTTEIQGGCGITCGYPRGISIEHNEVTGANYTGISVGYGWTPAVNAMSNNRINYNNIHGVAKILAGAAGIETMSNQKPASEMQYNYLHDFTTSPWADDTAHAFYLNRGTSGYTVAHNLIVRAPKETIDFTAGGNTVNDNGVAPSGAETTTISAGIEPIYQDIKDLTIPAATF